MTIENKRKKLKTDHIFRMTDDTGILHASKCGVPDLSMGYTSIDNARALIMAVKLFDQTHSKRVESLIYKYAAFLANAQASDGTFRNLMGYNREFSEANGSEECFGRCLFALSYTFANQNVPQSIKKTAKDMIDRALPHCLLLKSSRAMAYAIIGLSYLDLENTNGYISKMTASLVNHYVHYKSGEWHWFEDRLSGCNAAMPWSLLAAFRVTKEARYLKIGLESLQFLESKTFTECRFKPIGMKGLSLQGDNAASLDEQTVEASEAISAYIEAFKITDNIEYIYKARTCFFWYLGRNSKNISLLDNETGGCHDGIEGGGLNPNQGAESIISFWLAYLEINKYLRSGKTVKGEIR